MKEENYFLFASDNSKQLFIIIKLCEIRNVSLILLNKPRQTPPAVVGRGGGGGATAMGFS